ncbi:MAG: hypothetical protein SF066_20370 [Thermoanaerobaculia bacterium]|nr:hypothetical protein [Thermoanaerobaculia bacterium]
MPLWLIDLPAILVAGLVLGAHAAVPAGLRSPETTAGRARWAQAGLPLLLALLVATLLRVRLNPEPFVGSGLFPIGPSPVTAAVLITFGTLVVVDLFVLAFHRRLESGGWWWLAGFGGLGLLAWSAFEEAARIGSGPAITLEAYLGAVILRSGLGLATGLLLFTRPSSRFARLAGVGAAACAAALWLPTSPWVQASLVATGDLLTLGAGALLIAVGPFLPERFRRLSVVLGFSLVALFLARAGAVSEQLGQASRVPPPLP